MDIIRAPNIDDMKDVYPLRTTLSITTISLEISNFQCWLSSVENEPNNYTINLLILSSFSKHGNQNVLKNDVV